MSAQQHLDIVHLPHLFVVDSHQPHLSEAVALLAIVYDVAQAKQTVVLCQLLFRLADGSRHTEAEARTLVNFYLHVCKDTK